MKKVYLFSVLAVLSLQTMAQDAHFTQIQASTDWLNPAAAGALNGVQGNLIYRSQWNSIGDFYQTTYASGQFRFGEKNKQRGFSAAGITILNDRSGATRLNNLNAGLTYAYHIRLDDKQTFGAGIYAGFMQRRFTGDDLKWGSQYDGVQYNATLPGEIINTPQRSLFDVSAGVCWTWKSSETYMTANNQRMFRIGVGGWHLNRPNVGFFNTDKLAMRFSVHGDGLIGLGNTPLALVPSVLYQRQITNEILFGSLIRYTVKESSRYTGFVTSSSVAIGGYLRNRDSFAIAAQMQWSNYSLGINYDINISGLRTATNGRGGFEISFRYTGVKGIGKSSSF